jgi:hypothetical protein
MGGVPRVRGPGPFLGARWRTFPRRSRARDSEGVSGWQQDGRLEQPPAPPGWRPSTSRRAPPRWRDRARSSRADRSVLPVETRAHSGHQFAGTRTRRCRQRVAGMAEVVKAEPLDAKRSGWPGARPETGGCCGESDCALATRNERVPLRRAPGQHVFRELSTTREGRSPTRPRAERTLSGGVESSRHRSASPLFRYPRPRS